MYSVRYDKDIQEALMMSGLLRRVNITFTEGYEDIPYYYFQVLDQIDNTNNEIQNEEMKRMKEK